MCDLAETWVGEKSGAEGVSLSVDRLAISEAGVDAGAMPEDASRRGGSMELPSALIGCTCRASGGACADRAAVEEGVKDWIGLWSDVSATRNELS